jgi:hypothetical protein
MAGKFSLKMPDFHVAFRDPLLALPKESVLGIFCPEKSDGFGRV